MKNKPLMFLVFFIFLITIGFSSRGMAIKYEVGLEEDAELIWTCNVFDEDKMEDIFGKNWEKIGTGVFDDLEQGAKMQWKITDIDEDEMESEETDDGEDTFEIKYEKWKWTKDTDWGSKDDNEKEEAFKNPEHYEEDFIYENFAPMWLPTPVGEYMKELEQVLFEGYTIDGRVLLSITIELEAEELDDKYPKEDIKVLAMYTSKGILRSYKLYYSDHYVIIDISLDTPIGIEILLPISIAAALVIGTVYVLFKRVD